ncbi:MAG: hypothetical protein K8I00_03085 [Candidatus Omnitrophica bacterium]|nr:hypothetical protein [Candidatus Omnitrophota bacterium]
MKNRIPKLKNHIQPTIPREKLLQETALLYLKEALYKQKYEQCPELINTAARYGATAQDIQKVIARYVRRLEQGLVYEATAKQRGVLQGK